jgi:hypothetical protein
VFLLTHHPDCDLAAVPIRLDRETLTPELNTDTFEQRARAVSAGGAIAVGHANIFIENGRFTARLSSVIARRMGKRVVRAGEVAVGEQRARRSQRRRRERSEPSTRGGCSASGSGES